MAIEDYMIEHFSRNPTVNFIIGNKNDVPDTQSQGSVDVGRGRGQGQARKSPEPRGRSTAVSNQELMMKEQASLMAQYAK